MRLTLYEPVDNFTIGQHFGENSACSNEDRSGVVSAKADGTCPTGKVKLYPLLGMKGHTGLDIRTSHWQPLYASCEGTVIELQTEPERGLGIGILTNHPYETDHGTHHVKVRYWHLAAMLVKKGDQVQFGQHIGWCDNTGLSSGDHLHFEVKPYSNGENIFQSNGYYGAIDPEPYLINTNAKKLRSWVRKLREILAMRLEDLAEFAR